LHGSHKEGTAANAASGRFNATARSANSAERMFGVLAALMIFHAAGKINRIGNGVEKRHLWRWRRFFMSYCVIYIAARTVYTVANTIMDFTL
jgi:hypothetical protein